MNTEEGAQDAREEGTLDGATEGRSGSDEQDRTAENNRIARHNAQLAKELKAKSQRLEQLEKAEADRQKAEAEKQGDWQKQIELARKEAEQAKAEAAKFRNRDVERAILDAITEQATASPALVRGAYLAMIEDAGLERYPSPDALDDEVKSRIKTLKAKFGDLFAEKEPEPKPRGGPPPRTTSAPESRGGLYRGP